MKNAYHNTYISGAIVTATFFLLLYSIQWGKQKSEEWLSTFFLSMLESVLIIDPFLVSHMLLSHKKTLRLIELISVLNNYAVANYL